jgi:gluconate:H+ symporter, GntP family
MHPVLVLGIAIAVVFVLIIKVRMNAFIALVVAAITVGVLSPNMQLQEVMPKVAEIFGVMCGKIGIVIALAALIGQCLMESGAADKIVRVLVRLLGENRASLSLLTSGYVLSIPVFFDTVFYLLVPLARAMRVRMGKNYLLFLMSIAAGATITHSLVPPTPGPLAMAAELQIDLGIMIMVGAMVGLPASLAGWGFSVWRNKVIEVPFRETPGMTLADLEELAAKQEEHLPSFFQSMLPIVLPVLFITSNTLVHAVASGHWLETYTAFIGNPNFALMVSAGLAVRLLARSRGYSFAELAKPVEEALMSGGLIILITAAGGSFGGMLVEAGVGKTLGDMAADYSIPILLLSFLLAVLIKVAQGSGTVAMITVSAIMAPLVIGEQLSFHPVYIACAIGGGSLVGSWMNDSGFWVYKQMSGLTEMEALRTWTPLLAVNGLATFLITALLAWVLPLV